MTRMKEVTEEDKANYARGLDRRIDEGDFHLKGPDEWHSDLAQAMQEVAGQHLLTSAPKPKNPWISEQTLTKIAERGDLSSAGRYAEAALVDKAIRKMAKQDRAKWFSD
eukprot:88708-Alexandrium_andersonii.AAC.2